MDNLSLRILEVAKSGNILAELSQKYPTLVRNMLDNLHSVMVLFINKNCLHNYSTLRHYFEVNPFLISEKVEKCYSCNCFACLRCENCKKNANKPKKKLSEEVSRNLADFCEELLSSRHHTVPVRYLIEMKQKILNEIKKQYIRNYDDWPKYSSSIPRTIERPLNLNLKGSYDCEGYFLVWTCVGSLMIKETRSAWNMVEVKFKSALDTKCLVLNIAEANYWENYVQGGLKYLEHTVMGNNDAEKLALDFLAP